ncbi:hypothetical protein BU23DRAFT_191971 [Bimuria novae-zelandiae CBS 107.79]|uniref:C2H2-type domain-containing protein n=1 Tax=Bimuria novae-zelandiae CBS 107.79 TaxID=1447943 RepID=A0A6A5VVT8_9PLEO|nr:hypothetical protein BU23DRAFT_191971 [Bimuria novae-zelandiae CBS 107.79]
MTTRRPRTGKENALRPLIHHICLLAVDKAVFELLSSYLQAGIMPWDPRAFKADFGVLQKQYCLSKVVEAQLRFDITRSSLIAYLYDPCGLSSRLQDILRVFIETASPVAIEPYYLGAEPDEHGNCPWCGVYLSRIPMKIHLLLCLQKEKVKNAEQAQLTALQKSGWLCMWGACNTMYKDGSTLSTITSHLTSHLSRERIYCEWDECQNTFRNIIDLQIHLGRDHGAYTQATLPTRAEYCFECGIWITNELEWNLHCVRHAKSPGIIYGPVTVNGLLVEAGRCPYCMRDGLYRRIEKPSQYLQHVEGHLSEYGSVESLSCPHPSCGLYDFETIDELREHLSSVHYIPVKLK